LPAGLQQRDRSGISQSTAISRSKAHPHRRSVSQSISSCRELSQMRSMRVQRERSCMPAVSSRCLRRDQGAVSDFQRTRPFVRSGASAASAIRLNRSTW
jgi:hypothetical protein